MKHYYITNLTNKKALDIQLPWYVRNDKKAIEYLAKVQSQFPNDQLEMALVETKKELAKLSEWWNKKENCWLNAGFLLASFTVQVSRNQKLTNVVEAGNEKNEKN